MTIFNEFEPLKDLPLFEKNDVLPVAQKAREDFERNLEKSKKAQLQFEGHHVEDKDNIRLKNQLDVVRTVLRKWEKGARWLTVDEIHNITEFPHNSISAQIRNLRKERFGKLPIIGRYRSGLRVYEYKIVS
jgi:hypothetical protein